MSPQTGQIWKHDRKGGRYEIIYCCVLRNYDDPKIEKWRAGVIYKNEINVYVRNLSDFIKNFTKEKKK